ncbi:MAG: CoA-binding protein [Chloroflexi bacterium]|nr:CoA-binding protein [Chloroflexota bacterium]MBI3931174.1 CoA-binding protein [Chloroflexota bacterium]
MAWDPALEVAFHPRVVAMVGVSADTKRSGPRPGGGSSFISSYEQLGFQGRIYPVNPKTTKILGRKAYPNVSSIPEPVDLVVISVPAPAVPEVLEDCITANARNIHIYTSGFEETGEEAAKELGRRVRQIALRGGLRLIGPNCMGLYVPKTGIGSFAQLSRESGPVAFISQSGGHCNWFCHYAANYGIYFSKVISFGNAYILDSTDFLEYLAVDPDTGIICMYLEGVKDGSKLFRQVKEINRVKPVILWKAGLTESGSRAVASHTASLAGKEAIWRGFFAQTGAVPVLSLEEMAEMTMTFLYVKPPRGKRVAVLGSGGGSSVASADVCSREGLEVPALTQETQAELRKFISPAGTSIKNPLDTGLIFRDVSLLEREIALVAADPLIDMLIVRPHLDMAHSIGPDQVDRLVNYLRDFSRDNPHGKPMVLSFNSWANDPWEAELRARLQVELPQKGVPVYSSLDSASRALAKLFEYHRFQKEAAENQ